MLHGGLGPIWRNILQIAPHGTSDFYPPEDRIPALFLHSQWKRLLVFYPFNKEENPYATASDVIEEMKNYHIVIQLCPEADQAVFRFILNGQEMYQQVIPSPEIYEKVTLYGSSPMWASFEDEDLGTFENLRVYPSC